MAELESNIESYFKTQAEKQGFLFYKFTSPSNSGVPDRIIIGHGHTVFVELKRPGKKPRKLQNYVIEKMRNHGATVYVIDNKTDTDNLLKKLIENKKGK